MICYTDKLDTVINTGCPTTFGMERNGYLCLRSEINPKTETDLVVSFVPRFIIPVYQPSENAYKPKSEGEKNAYGLTKFQKSIEVFLVANTQLSQEQIMSLKDDDWVAVLKQRDETIIVFGFERGLRLKTTSQDLNSTETHGGILLTFDENQVNSPMLFGSETLYDWSDFDTIYGGTIANGGAVKLTIDSDKTGYIKLPNGTLLTTVAGVINTTYSGVGGAITYYVPKLGAINDLIVSESDLIGAIKYNGILTESHFKSNNTFISELILPSSLLITTNNCNYLSNITAPKVSELYASGCALTAKSIGDILYQAYVDARMNVVYDFSGGTNASWEEDPVLSIVDYLNNTYGSGMALIIVSALELNGGTILINNL